MSQSSLSDSVILRETKFSPPDSKGRVQLSFVLPSGRKVTSTDWLVPEEIKGKVLIAWANAIRAEDDFDIQQREEAEKLARAEKRAREISSSAPTDSAVPAQSKPSSGLSGSSGSAPAGTSQSSSTLPSLPDDPRELIVTKLRGLRMSLAEAEDLRDAAIQRIGKLQQSIAQWEVVMRGLPSPEPATEASNEQEREPSEIVPSSKHKRRRKSRNDEDHSASP